MASSTPASPGPAVVAVPASHIGSLRSAPGLATRTPVHLGLSVHTSTARTSAGAGAGAAPRKTVPSLSIRTADGSCVSILNDCDDSGAASADHKRCSSVPGISSPGSSPTSASPFRAQSTPGATTPQQQQQQQQQPSMLPSLSTLVQAVHMVSSAAAPPPPSTTMKRSISTSSGVGHHHHHPYYSDPHSHAHASQSPAPMSAPPVSAPPAATSAPVPAYASGAPAGTKTTGKRKYKCVFAGCGKAFTTSGHLARHQRIHTGEKNFPCLFPGCTSRFSRQDNMMQHYRTHLSTKSRRNASPRKVVFVEQASDSYRAAHGLYSSPVYSGSHPIQHHPQHRPYGPPQQRTPASARAAAAHPQGSSSSAAAPRTGGFQHGGAPSVGGGHKASAHYGLPPVHMLSGSGAAGGSTPSTPHNLHHHAGMAKQSPAVAHSGAMSFY